MTVTPAEVLRHTAPTRGFLCPLSANEYKIEFLSFIIQDYDSKKVIFEVSRDRPLPIDFSMHDSMDPDSLRKINYELSEDFLRLPKISTTLVFSVGQEPLTDFRMIERHYFRDQLIKSYDFSFGFCIPGSTNTWEAVYALPPMDSSLIDDMVAHPYATSSDSFYFVGDKLIMHNKAFYKYIPEDSSAQCKSYETKYGSGAKGDKMSAKAQAKESKVGSADAKAAAKATPGAKAAAKTSRDDIWSKESDYA